MSRGYMIDGGRQLGEFLRKLHSLKPNTEIIFPLNDLIRAWQARYAKAKKTLVKYFNTEELADIDALTMREMPDTLQELGEKRVFLLLNYYRCFMAGQSIANR